MLRAPPLALVFLLLSLWQQISSASSASSGRSNAHASDYLADEHHHSSSSLSPSARLSRFYQSYRDVLLSWRSFAASTVSLLSGDAGERQRRLSSVFGAPLHSSSNRLLRDELERMRRDQPARGDATQQQQQQQQHQHSVLSNVPGWRSGASDGSSSNHHHPKHAHPSYAQRVRRQHSASEPLRPHAHAFLAEKRADPSVPCSGVGVLDGEPVMLDICSQHQCMIADMQCDGVSQDAVRYFGPLANCTVFSLSCATADGRR